jgi:predicted porin
MTAKTLAVGLALSLPMLVCAQSTTGVTLYGVMDVGSEYLNNTETRTPINGLSRQSVSRWGFQNVAGLLASRWGMRGSEDLGGGWSTIFTLEQGVNPADGSLGQGGRAFGRQAFMGTKAGWGQLTFGRQYSMTTWTTVYADFIGPSSFGIGSLDGYLAAPRIDNMFSYLGNFNGFRVGAAWARGRDASPGTCNQGNGSQCTAYSFLLGYDGANWGIATGYDVLGGNGSRGGSSARTNALGLWSDEKDRRWTMAGYFKFDAARVGMIYIHRKSQATDNNRYTINGTPTVFTPLNATDNAVGLGLGNRSDILMLNADYKVTPAITLAGAISYLRFPGANDNAGGPVGSHSLYYIARAKYDFSKRTSLYIQTAFMNNKGNANQSVTINGTGSQPGRGKNQTGLSIGLNHVF